MAIDTITPTAAADKPVRRAAGSRMPGEKAMVASPSAWFVWAGMATFLVFLIGIITAVVVDSFGKQWFNTWLPLEFTTSWYSSAWSRFDLGHVIGVTIGVALAVVVLSILIGVPAAYLLARRDFPGKRAISLLFLLPILMPPMTFGIPLATVMYAFGLGRSVIAVILVNLVPSVPFVILTMTPFIEQINPAIESAARMCGATLRQVFTRILAPLLVPGILAAGILVLVRTVGMFELTFLVSGPQSDTLVVAIYRAMTSAGGGEARQLISAMAVLYTTTMLVMLIAALRFVNPTQLVAQVKEARDD